MILLLVLLLVLFHDNAIHNHTITVEARGLVELALGQLELLLY